mmetsp:Transcript_6729/g.19339  ORF Transcript_6729/g.19339 Transcript_6729/m.19339 type:complete len:203 (+) Transcript_6729:1156-1764(+)
MPVVILRAVRVPQLELSALLREQNPSLGPALPRVQRRRRGRRAMACGVVKAALARCLVNAEPRNKGAAVDGLRRRRRQDGVAVAAPGAERDLGLGAVAVALAGAAPGEPRERVGLGEVPEAHGAIGGGAREHGVVGGPGERVNDAAVAVQFLEAGAAVGVVHEERVGALAGRVVARAVAGGDDEEAPAVVVGHGDGALAPGR